MFEKTKNKGKRGREAHFKRRQKDALERMIRNHLQFCFLQKDLCRLYTIVCKCMHSKMTIFQICLTIGSFRFLVSSTKELHIDGIAATLFNIAIVKEHQYLMAGTFLANYMQMTLYLFVLHCWPTYLDDFYETR